MTSPDLPRVVGIARLAFPDHLEDADCLGDRLALAPDSCFALADGAAVHGYLIAYPGRTGEPSVLNSRMAVLPDAPDALYLHDLALDPAVRGGDHARAGLERLIEAARAGGWPRLSLVAVNGAEGFWARHGFRSAMTPVIAARLASYGAGAVHMVRDLDPVRPGGPPSDS